MPRKKTSAGDFIESVAFEELGAASDGGGGVLSGYTEQFKTRAKYIHLRGGESVMAGRLAGKHAQIIRVRSFVKSRKVNASWRIVDQRTGDIFNIRDITPSNDRQYLDFLCEKGVAVNG